MNNSNLSVDDFLQVLQNQNPKSSIFLTKNEEYIIVHGDGNIEVKNDYLLPENVIWLNRGAVFLNSIQIIPSNWIFRNKGSVFLATLKEIDTPIIFHNSGSVYLPSVLTISVDQTFFNHGYVDLANLTCFTGNILFKNRGPIYLMSIYKKAFDCKYRITIETGHDVYMRQVNTLPDELILNSYNHFYAKNTPYQEGKRALHDNQVKFHFIVTN